MVQWEAKLPLAPWEKLRCYSETAKFPNKIIDLMPLEVEVFADPFGPASAERPFNRIKKALCSRLSWKTANYGLNHSS